MWKIQESISKSLRSKFSQVTGHKVCPAYVCQYSIIIHRSKNIIPFTIVFKKSNPRNEPNERYAGPLHRKLERHYGGKFIKFLSKM